jgi:hypothetical protein
VRCRECGHEYLPAYSCKRRYFCTSCHTKRAVAFAEWLHGTVLWPVAHRQIVLTTPKMLRVYFRYDRRLMATEGAFTPAGNFHALPAMSLAPIEELFRHQVCGMLQRKGLLTPERVKLAAGRENLARYLIRAPFSMNKIRHDPKAQSLIYKTKLVPGANRNFEIFDPLDRTFSVEPLQVCDHGDSCVGVLFDLPVLLPGAPSLLPSSVSLPHVQQSGAAVPDGFHPSLDRPPRFST